MLQNQTLDLEPPNIHVDPAKRPLHGNLQESAVTLVTGGTMKVVLV